MSDKQEADLTVRQEAFVNAYLDSFNATKAAETAGYAHPAVEGCRLLKHPKIKSRINQHLDTIRDEGIGNRAIRLSQLNDLNDDLRSIQSARAEEARQRAEAGEVLPAGFETGLLIEQTKTQGSGRSAQIVKEFVVDKTLVQERQRVLEQAAKETGDRDKRLIELSGPEGTPIQVESAKDKLRELIQTD